MQSASNHVCKHSAPATHQLHWNIFSIHHIARLLPFKRKLAFTESVSKIYDISESLCIDILSNSTAGKMDNIAGCSQPVHYGDEPSELVI